MPAAASGEAPPPFGSMLEDALAAPAADAGAAGGGKEAPGRPETGLVAPPTFAPLPLPVAPPAGPAGAPGTEGGGVPAPSGEAGAGAAPVAPVPVPARPGAAAPAEARPAPSEPKPSPSAAAAPSPGPVLLDAAASLRGPAGAEPPPLLPGDPRAQDNVAPKREATDGAGVPPLPEGVAVPAPGTEGASGTEAPPGREQARPDGRPAGVPPSGHPMPEAVRTGPADRTRLASTAGREAPAPAAARSGPGSAGAAPSLDDPDEAGGTADPSGEGAPKKEADAAEAAETAPGSAASLPLVAAAAGMAAPVVPAPPNPGGSPPSDDGADTAVAARRLGHAPQPGARTLSPETPGSDPPAAEADAFDARSPGGGVERRDGSGPKRETAEAPAAPPHGPAAPAHPGAGPERAAAPLLPFDPAVPAGGAAPAGPHPGTGHIPVVSGVPVSEVPVEIGLKSLAGIQRFEIRLAPEELGRIDIRLDIASDGTVKADLLVDRPETLAFLRRDSAGLERSLEQAGLKPGEGGLSMTLRDGSGDGSSPGRGGPGSGDPAGDGSGGRQPGSRDRAGTDRTAAEPTEAAGRIGRTLWSRASGIDLRI